MRQTQCRKAVCRAGSIVVLTAVVLVGCTSKGEQIAGKIQKKLESTQIPVKSVTCDQKTAKKGDKFGCTATTTDGTVIKYAVTMTADDHFDAQATTKVVLKADLEKLIVEQGKTDTGETDVTASCGAKALYTEAQLAEAKCTGKVDGVPVPLTVAVQNGSIVSYPSKPLVVKAKVETELAAELKRAAGDGTTFTVDCGSAKAKVLDSSAATFTCSGVASDSSKGTITAKIQDDGTAKITDVKQTS